MVLRQILLHPPAYVMPEPQMPIPFSRQKFDVETGNLVDEKTRDRLRRFLESLVEWSGSANPVGQRERNLNEPPSAGVAENTHVVPYVVPDDVLRGTRC
jgi:hypothetical protein